MQMLVRKPQCKRPFSFQAYAFQKDVAQWSQLNSHIVMTGRTIVNVVNWEGSGHSLSERYTPTIIYYAWAGFPNYKVWYLPYRHNILCLLCLLCVLIPIYVQMHTTYINLLDSLP